MPNENEVESIVREAEQVVCRLMASIQLTHDEKQYVDEAARHLNKVAFDLLMRVDPEKQERMRGVVTSVAIAMGNRSRVWDGGVDALCGDGARPTKRDI